MNELQQLKQALEEALEESVKWLEGEWVLAYRQMLKRYNDRLTEETEKYLKKLQEEQK